MKVINYAFFFLSFLVVSCRTPARHVELADKEMFAFAREVKKTDNLRLVGYGGGFYEKINRFSLTFISPQYPDSEEARILFFNIANRFLYQVNQNEELRPYMSNYPFTIMDNLELLIIFPPSKEAINAVGIGPIFSHRKRESLVFTGYNPATQDFDGIYTEPFEEALQIYEQQICH